MHERLSSTKTSSHVFWIIFFFTSPSIYYRRYQFPMFSGPSGRFFFQKSEQQHLISISFRQCNPYPNTQPPHEKITKKKQTLYWAWYRLDKCINETFVLVDVGILSHRFESVKYVGVFYIYGVHLYIRYVGTLITNEIKENAVYIFIHWADIDNSESPFSRCWYSLRGNSLR